ncbi:MAG: hypothetical protein SF051_14995 [Elusimicrobiota bacterium]|nr:hypothetical protein [Elusimicrobiota bacterium]
MPHQLKGLAALVAARRALARGARRDARRALDRCLRADPACLPALLLRAAAGPRERALADLEAADRLPPSAVVAYGDLALPPLPGLTAKCRALADETASAWAKVILSFALRSESKMDEAAQAMDGALARRRSPELLAIKARLDLSGPRASYKGSKLLREAARMAPDEGWLRCWLGEALRHEGDPAGALAALDEGLRLAPDYRPARAWRAALLIALGRPKRALADLGLALRPSRASGALDPEQAADARAWALHQRSLARRALGDLDGALADLGAAHALGPRYAWCRPDAKPAERAAALVLLDRRLLAAPGDARAWAWRGHALLHADREPEALECLDRAAALAPRAAWVLALRGLVLLRLGRLAEAESALSLSLRRDGRSADAYGWRGETRLAAGWPRDAEKDFTAAARLDFRSAWARRGRALARAAQGRTAAALEDLRAALAIHPEYEEARRLVAELSRGAA